MLQRHDLELVVVWNGTMDGPDSEYNRASPAATAHAPKSTQHVDLPTRILGALRQAYPSALTHSQIAGALGLRTDAATLYTVSQVRFGLQRHGRIECAYPQQRTDGRTGRPLLRFRYMPMAQERDPR
jgi:hypothetical protein